MARLQVTVDGNEAVARITSGARIVSEKAPQRAPSPRPGERDTRLMPDPRDAACSVCGIVPAAWASKVCPICARTVCVKCGHAAYGRTYCSTRCAEFFFHGDGDEDDRES